MSGNIGPPLSDQDLSTHLRPEFHPRAVNDLDEILDFIAADSLDAADG